jgi:hypothetical protein
MRKPNSLFTIAVEYLNSMEIGTEFTTKDYINKVGKHEVTTRWKRGSNDYYRTYTYRTYLKRLGFVKNISRGRWQIVQRIPDCVDSGVVNIALGHAYPRPKTFTLSGLCNNTFKDGKCEVNYKDFRNYWISSHEIEGRFNKFLKHISQ